MALQKVRENHNGAKRGRGAWMTKREAKKAAKKMRRRWRGDV